MLQKIFKIASWIKEDFAEIDIVLHGVIFWIQQIIVLLKTKLVVIILYQDTASQLMAKIALKINTLMTLDRTAGLMMESHAQAINSQPVVI